MVNNPMTAYPEPVFAARRDRPVTSTVGDWLLTFGIENPAGPTRSSTGVWVAEAQGATWRLSRSAPGESWSGMPMTAVAAPGWSAWLFGELYATADPVEIIADVVEGRSSPTILNGHFLLLAQDRQTGEWHIWTNRYATLHAYVATNGPRVAIGSFMPAVAGGVGRDGLDWEGLTSFFGFGFFMGDRTHFQGVRILRPATHYRFDGDGRALGEARYWHWQHMPDRARSYDETVDEFAALFGDVMSGLTADGRIAVPVSGGLDSRSTVATLGRQPGKISPTDEGLWAYSYGYGDDSIETRIAGELAARRGLRFDAFTIRPYLFDRITPVIGAVEGFQDMTQARQAFIGRELRANADAVIAAHWGDVYLGDMGLAATPPGALSGEAIREHALHKMRKPGGWLIDMVCRPHLGKVEPEELLHSFVAEGMDGLEDIADADFRVKAFKTEQWSARWTTASLRMYQAAVWPRLPFYDTRLGDFFATVPTEFVAGRRLQIDYLKRFAPDLAAVPWQESGSSLFKVGQPDPMAVVRRGFNKGRRILTGRRVIESNWEVQFLNESGRHGLEQWLLRRGLRLHEFVAPPRIEALLTAFQSAPRVDKRSYTVSMLLTFSAWLESFGGGADAP